MTRIMSEELNERARAMIHDLIVAITEGRETTEHEPVPRSIGVLQFNRALGLAIKHHKRAHVEEVRL